MKVLNIRKNRLSEKQYERNLFYAFENNLRTEKFLFFSYMSGVLYVNNG